MSQQPPPPYGGPPGPYPPSPYQGPPGQPPGGMSNKAKFWIGVALTIPFIIASSIVTGGGSALTTAVGADPQVGALVSSFLGLVVLAGFIASIVLEKTRWFALGILAGTAVLFILAAGACVVLIIGLSQGFS